MSKFKKGDIVEVSKSSNKVLRLLKNKTQGKGEIIKVVRGTYNKTTKKYTLDKYFVLLDNGITVVECAKKDLTKIPTEPIVSNDKEEKFSYYLNTESNHYITVVGVRTEKKENKFMTTNVSNVVGKGETHLISVIPQKMRRFSIGYSICHIDDVFDIETGFEVAYRRAKSEKRRMGYLETPCWTMLQDDQCKELVKNEAVHIAKNLHKYIDRK